MSHDQDNLRLLIYFAFGEVLGLACYQKNFLLNLSTCKYSENNQKSFTFADFALSSPRLVLLEIADASIRLQHADFKIDKIVFTHVDLEIPQSDKLSNVLAVKMLSASETNMINAKRLFESTTTVKSLYIEGKTDGNIEILSKAVESYAEQLRSLRISSCSQVKNHHLRQLFSTRSVLIKLEILTCKTLKDEEIRILARHQKSLKEVTLEHCPLISDKGMYYLFSNLKHMKKVKLRRDALNKEKKINFMLTDANLSEIVELKLCGFSITDIELFCAFESVRFRMTKLDFSFCKQLTDKTLLLISTQCAQLETLILNSVNLISNTGIACLLELRHLTSLSLSHLKLINTRTSVNENPTNELFKCKALKNLNISGCTNINFQECEITKSLGFCRLNVSKLTFHGNSFLNLLRNVPLLTELNISHCQGVSKRSIRVLGRYCSSLTVLKANGLTNMTNSGLIGFLHGMKCVKLQELSLNENNISDLGLNVLCDSSMKHLRKLSLEKISSISIDIVDALFTNFCCLIALNLKKATGYFLADIQRFARSRSCLSVLTKETFLCVVRSQLNQSQLVINEAKFHVQTVTNLQRWIKNQIFKKFFKLNLKQKCFRQQNLRETFFLVWKNALREQRRKDEKNQKNLNQRATQIVLCYRKKVAQKKQKYLVSEQKLEESHRSAICLQNAFRRYDAFKIVQARFHKKMETEVLRNDAAIIIQRCHRLYSLNNELQLRLQRSKAKHAEKTKAILKIQSVFRLVLAQAKVSELKQKLNAEENNALNKKKFLTTWFNNVDYICRDREETELVNTRESATRMIQFFLRRVIKKTNLKKKSMSAKKEKVLKALILLQRFQRNICRNTVRKQEYIKSQNSLKQKNKSAMILQRVYKARVKRKLVLHEQEVKKKQGELQIKLAQWAAVVVQKHYRAQVARKAFNILQEQRSKSWRIIFEDQESTVSLYFHDICSGKSQWHIPKEILSLLPDVYCDNCVHEIAKVECHDCAELYCVDCYNEVHRGGKRYYHSTRAVYDAYGEKIEHLDDINEKTFLWPSQAKNRASFSERDDLLAFSTDATTSTTVKGLLSRSQDSQLTLP